MNSFFPAYLLLIVFAVAQTQSRRTTRQIYVAPTGDDTATGASNSPFRTIQHAVDSAAQGDTVTIREGVYPEQVRMTRSGSYFDRQITVQAEPGHTVTLTSFDTGGQDHLIIRGLTARNSPYLGIAIQGSYRIRLENCRSESSRGSGIFVDKSNDVIVSHCDVSHACQNAGEESVSIKRSTNVVFEDSTVHNTGHEGIDVKEGSRHVVVRRNHVFAVERQGLYADGWDADTGDIRFENNVIYDCMVGLVACTEAGGLLHDVTFVGNLVYDCRGPGMMLAKWGAPSRTHHIKNVAYLNNTVVHCGGGGQNGDWGGGMLIENDQTENITVVNNILSGNPFAQLAYTLGLPAPKGMVCHHNLLDGPGNNITEHNLIAPASFVDLGAKDFRPTPSSKAINAGAKDPNIGETDIAGKPRLHQGHTDIGAFSSVQ